MNIYIIFKWLRHGIFIAAIFIVMCMRRVLLSNSYRHGEVGSKLWHVAFRIQEGKRCTCHAIVRITTLHKEDDMFLQLKGALEG